MSRFLPDPFVPAVLATLLLATLWPATGAAEDVVGTLATAAVMLLFFLHGVKLPRENLLAALTHWRLHLLILGSTFLLFPGLGLALSRLFPALLPAHLWAGVLFLCALPSTVNMSIAFTSMARGNVGASVTSAAVSNLLGIIITPIPVRAALSIMNIGIDRVTSITGTKPRVQRAELRAFWYQGNAVENSASSRKNSDQGWLKNSDTSALMVQARFRFSSASSPSTTPRITGARGKPNFFMT
jgi:hypothetical protein